MRYVASFILAALLLLPTSTGRAQESGVEVGVRAGGNWSLLTKPGDLRGEPTLLGGSAFDGFGYTVGASAEYAFLPLPFGLLFGELDVLYSFHRGSGFAENPDTDQRRTVTIQTSMIRVPVLIGVDYPFDGASFRLVLGPELTAGISSASTVEEENIEGEPQPLLTTPVTHLGLTGGGGLSFRVGDWKIPLDFRVAFDPFVEDKTVHRFQGYESADAPGDYEVAFDWSLMLLLGANRSF